jgi:hypothetical protein
VMFDSVLVVVEYCGHLCDEGNVSTRMRRAGYYWHACADPNPGQAP